MYKLYELHDFKYYLKNLCIYSSSYFQPDHEISKCKVCAPLRAGHIIQYISDVL